jgi:hypothetical protein
MTAGIVKGPDLLLAVTNNDDGIAADLNREEIAGLRHFAIMADEQPVTIEDVFHVETVVIRIRIEFPFKAIARLPVLQIPEKFVGCVHVVSSPFAKELTGGEGEDPPCRSSAQNHAP